jgi:hypothetical protein
MLRILKHIITHPRENIVTIIFILIVLASIYVLLTSSAAEWRHMYCIANEAQAIECTVKGWW